MPEPVTRAPMILVIDNRDSFVQNIARYLRLLGAETVVRRSDELTLDEIETLSPTRIVISPGPGRPEDAGVSVEVIERFSERVPILGICLGHQCIVSALGGVVTAAHRPIHGSSSAVYHAGEGLFGGLPSPFEAGRYHSLAAPGEELPAALKVTAWTADGEVMALEHRERPLWGLQFHPESVLTPNGDRILGRFLSFAAEWEHGSAVDGGWRERAGALVRSGASDSPSSPGGGRGITSAGAVPDRGMVYGQGAFETVLVRNGAPFRLDAHLDRLDAALQLLDIQTPWGDRQRARTAVAEALRAGGSTLDRDHVLRIVVSHGPGPGGLEPGPSTQPRSVLSLTPAPERAPHHPLRACIASRPRLTTGYGAGHKLFGYVDAILALREARATGAEEVIFLDPEEMAVGGSSSNLFIVCEGMLITPPALGEREGGERLSGVRPGVTRECVLELAAEFGIPVDIRPIARAELGAADEIFLTSSIRGPVNVGWLDEVPVGRTGSGGSAGSRIGDRLRAGWERLVEAVTRGSNGHPGEPGPSAG